MIACTTLRSLHSLEDPVTSMHGYLLNGPCNHRMPIPGFSTLELPCGTVSCQDDVVVIHLSRILSSLVDQLVGNNFFVGER